MWGAPKDPAGNSKCAIPSDWVNFTCYKSPTTGAFVTAGGVNPCTPWTYLDSTGTLQNMSFGINYQGYGQAVSYTGSPANAAGQVANANGYFPGTPAPCCACPRNGYRGSLAPC